MADLVRDGSAAVVGTTLIVVALILAARPRIIDAISRDNQAVTQRSKLWGLMTDSDYDRERRVMKFALPAFLFVVGVAVVLAAIR